MREHKQCIVELKRAQNSLLNIFRIPSEIMGRIFWWSTVPGECRDRSYTFLSVCHHWYEVAMRTPGLWDFWGYTLPSWTKLHLRYPDTPLDLVLDGGTSKGEPLDAGVENTLRDRTSRDTIRLVHLRSSDSDLLHSILCALAGDRKKVRHCSSVESFTLRVEGNGSVDTSEFFAHNSFPNLQHLDLTNCAVLPWDNLTLYTTSLTTLILHLSTSSTIPSISQLLSFLSSNPALRRFVLTGFSFPDDDEDENPPRVLLPHLKELDLAGESGCASMLLKKLDHPDIMDHVKITLPHCAAADIPRTIGPYLLGHLQRRSRSGKNLGLYISLSGRALAFHVDAADGFHPSARAFERMVSITINVDNRPRGDLPEELILDLIESVPREKITHLQTFGNPLAISDVYALLPNLVSLYSKNVRLYTTLRIPSPDPEGPLLPHLRHLSFERVVAHWDKGWTPLVALLSSHASSGKPLDSLEITAFTYMSPRVEKDIRNLVREFILVPLQR